ncbi:MAG: hypothetical protein NZ899_07945 [Thermoguttaceae bacterium]|nr:hypothetical protein [Thermoguttaceae bacterium]MDW8078124.1 Sir2 family NAD-dependent protein deacetylase [Thermoguttaceae bacterium]
MQETEQAVAEAARLLRQARSVVVFSGAGISAESGIPTFRDSGGWWERFPVEQFGTWTGLLALARDRPRELAEYLVTRLRPVAEARPNPSHRAVRDMERFCRVTVVTQNIDGLHTEAGSSRVVEIHGSLLRVVWVVDRTVKAHLSRQELKAIVDKLGELCQTGRPSFRRLLLALQPIFGVGWRGLYRPDVVLFGDAMVEPEWTHALHAVRSCQVIVSVGTSGQVFPAAMLPMEAKRQGAAWIHVDPQEPAGDIWIKGRAGEILPLLVNKAWPA